MLTSVHINRFEDIITLTKRIFDLIMALGLMLILAPLFLLVVLAVMLTSVGPVLFRTRRSGKNSRLFTMYKFRTMRMDTPQVATHLLKNPDQFLTPVGAFLRRTSLDELPQLINVLRGDMSLVGPRPALFNQEDLIALRAGSGVDALIPGITGWAQVNGRDELPILEKVKLDVWYMKNRSFWFDVKILVMTAFKVLRKDGVSH
jgi:O-antigen biosynthesis protein WbqP